MPRVPSCLCIAFLAASALPAEEILGLPLHIQKVDPATLRLWVGDTGRSSAVVAFATKQGIVVVDTLGIPAVDRELRKVIAREFKRKDFKVLINTHEHGDHTGGNEVYADCAIVAQARCAEGMKEQFRILKEWLPRMNDQIRDLEGKLAKAGEGPEAKALSEALRFAKLEEEAYRTVKPTLPTQTFSDRKTLSMGDTTFELYYTGGVHSGSDIAILVPERGVLATGDVMADTWCTEVSGCMASFMVRPDTPHDFPALLKNWDALLARKGEIKTFLPGHWNGSLSLLGFERRVAYIRGLYEGMQAYVKTGKPLEGIFREFPLKARFPELVGAPSIDDQTHGSTLLGLYGAITGMESAALKVKELIAASADEKAIQAVLADRGRESAKYYFLENEFNSWGYHLLQINQPAQALTLFKVCVEMYPGSWNAHDSLAEAYAKLGDKTQAALHYEKSLALNPENGNGKEMLAKLAVQ